ncbi:SPFH domain-containing protein [Actinopolymorpha sp. B17G11]|uniref:SPFH domain-containing protein n=1 Tax=unclassified Actinopolymorpha TaxID=2627063 RepID=UPI0032D8DFAE
MADIQRYPFVRHLRGAPTVHVRHQRRGRLVREGAGLAFWFRPLSAVLSEVPVDDRELPMLFHARSSDFQDVTVQATVTYRVTDPATAAGRLDFSVDPDTGRWRSTPLELLGSLVAELAQQPALELLAATTLAEALAAGVGSIRDRILSALADDARLRGLGIAVLGVRVVALRPEPEMEKALQTPAREGVQQEADRATFERRALAVERERAIAENELQNQIELAVREEQLVTQRGQNQRRQAEETAAADRVGADAKAERQRVLAAGQADATRVIGAADGAAEAAKLAAYQDVDPRILLALALRQLAGALPNIGTLNLSPDLITTALGTLVQPGDQK